MAALTGPKTCTLTLPRRFKCSHGSPATVPRSTSTGSKPRPTTLARPGRHTPGSPVVEKLLNRKTLRGRTYYSVRWQGRPSDDDSWEPVNLLRASESPSGFPGAGRNLKERGARSSTPPEPPLLPRGRLPARHRGLRGRGRLAPGRGGLVRLSLGLARARRDKIWRSS